MSKVQYGWYSAKAADAFGCSIYKDANGNKVHVSAVTSNAADHNTNWPDIVFVGRVYMRIEDAPNSSSLQPLADYEWVGSDEVRQGFEEMMFDDDDDFGFDESFELDHY